MTKGQQVLAALASLSIAGCAAPPPPAAPSSRPLDESMGQTFSELDVLERSLAHQMPLRLEWLTAQGEPDPDLAVEVYRGGPTLGAIVRGTRNHLVSTSKCRTPQAPAPTAINVFSSVKLDGAAAVKLGLPLPAAALTADGSNGYTLLYSLEDAHLQIIPDDDLDALRNAPSCRALIASMQAKRGSSAASSRQSAASSSIAGAASRRG